MLVGKKRGGGQRAGEGHCCICMCAQASCSPKSGSCWVEREFHQNRHAKIHLTRGTFQSTAGRELPGLVNELLVAKADASCH